ncbi:hypothetical protein NEMBOFW57_010386 [Staphylotrichum longicolle]|uniref:Uncharacterized protein n=1 Tax=Staphylotrichum longicolle TaxID=669026 RepID=A0AAD4HWY8_9PEZI|nr:hypothetical protein NEMBOFW57_010386 [Staphylotrichum longicolle]
MAADVGHGPLTTLPKPSLTFTVPSLHDGLPIDCRVYHPHSLAASPDAPSWQKHAAIIAHPYAPLGGCYDDPIVDIVASTLLRLGFLVGTFNFRTSWTAKAERADYMSVVGFVSHYVHFLDPFKQGLPSRPASASRDDGVVEAGGRVQSKIRIRPPTPTSPEPASSAARPILLLGGYSYGSMITSQLPALETIVAVFKTPECGTHAAEVRLRAQHLAEMQNTVLASARAAAADHLRPMSPRKHVGLRVGGDEENRKSHEFRRSLSAEFEETIRHGVAELMARTRKGHKWSHKSATGKSLEPTALARTVSPEAEDKLVQNSTLAIYGDRDGFVPVRKLRDWASRLEAMQGSKFRAHEVSSANHFWAQRNVASTLREAVRSFAASLLDGKIS